MAIERDVSAHPTAEFPSLVSLAPKAGASLSLARDVTLIGSGPSVRLRLRSAAISRCHTAIIFDGAALYLRDLSRRSNTSVNGSLVAEIELHAGDHVTIGPFVFEVQVGPARPISPAGDRAIAAMTDVGAGQTTGIAGRTFLLGRTENCDLRLNSTNVSSAHALIFEINGRHQIRDLNSRTGVRVNGIAVKQSALVARDRIQIGDYELLYGISAIDAETPDANPIRSDDSYAADAPPANPPANPLAPPKASCSRPPASSKTA